MTDVPNIVLLSVDALRADHLGAHGYHRDTSPFLDDLADDELAFETAISASSHTREALPALLSGRYPDVFAANGYQYVPKTVADRLSEAGFRTAGFHSNPYVSRAYGFDSGFNTFDDDLVLGRNRLVALAQRALNKFVLNRGEYHARAAEINKRSLSWLDGVSEDEPFFLWNHYMDVHGPYNPPITEFSETELSNADAQKLYQKCIKRPDELTNKEQSLLVDLYDDEIRYLDSHLRAFFEKLERRGLRDKSLVIVTADHGDAFGEHGYYGHPRHLHDELIHVPLLISTPDGRSETISEPMSTLDIVPTIHDWAGVSGPSLPGTSLLDAEMIDVREPYAIASAQGENDNAHIRRFAARGKQAKYILERNAETGDLAEEKGFDLEADPDEQQPVDDLSEELQQLRDALADHSSRRITDASTIDEDETPDEIEERLEALGYK